MKKGREEKFRKSDALGAVLKRDREEHALGHELELIEMRMRMEFVGLVSPPIEIDAGSGVGFSVFKVIKSDKVDDTGDSEE